MWTITLLEGTGEVRPIICFSPHCRHISLEELRVHQCFPCHLACGRIPYLGNLGPAGALFQVLCGACYVAVASFLLPGQGFQTAFFYLCGWKRKFQIRIAVGQSHLGEHVHGSPGSRWLRTPYLITVKCLTQHASGFRGGWPVHNTQFCDSSEPLMALSDAVIFNIYMR